MFVCSEPGKNVVIKPGGLGAAMGRGAGRGSSPAGRGQDTAGRGRGQPSAGRGSTQPGRGSTQPGRGSAQAGRGSTQPGRGAPPPGRGRVPPTEAAKSDQPVNSSRASQAPVRGQTALRGRAAPKTQTPLAGRLQALASGQPLPKATATQNRPLPSMAPGGRDPRRPQATGQPSNLQGADDRGRQRERQLPKSVKPHFLMSFL